MSGGARPAVEDALHGAGVRREYPRPERGDFDRASHALEGRQVGVGQPLDLDPVGARQAATGEPPAAGEASDTGLNLTAADTVIVYDPW